MNMKFLLLIPISLILLLSSACNKEDFKIDEDNYLVFGHYYGQCIGEECIETFKLTDSKLFEDTNDNYGGGDFNFIALDQTLFNQVKDLEAAFPAELLNDDGDGTFGCPDCADGGGLLIQYVEDGNINTWRIDQAKQNVPKYLYEFMDQVNEKIALINQ